MYRAQSAQYTYLLNTDGGLISFMTKNCSYFCPSLPSQRCFLGPQERLDQEKWHLKVSRWKRGIDTGVFLCQRGWDGEACQQQVEVTVLWPTWDAEILCFNSQASFPYSFYRSCSVVSHSIQFHTSVVQESSSFHHFLFSSQNFFLSLDFNPSQSLLFFCFTCGIEYICCLDVTFFFNSYSIGSQFLVSPQGLRVILCVEFQKCD